MTPGFGRAPAVLLRILLGAAVVVAVGAAEPGCIVEDGGCPCGADPYAPVDEHDASFIGRHVLEDGCACRCGGEQLEPWPLDREGGCEHRDVECETPSGEVTPLVCE